MRKGFLVLRISWLIIYPVAAQNSGFIEPDSAKFSTGNQPDWKENNFQDASWQKIKLGSVWQEQGYESYHGYAWYRIHIFLPVTFRQNGYWKDSLRIFLAHINDVDETYLNGSKIGKTGSFPEDPGGYISKWPAVRSYHLSINNPAIHWGQENIISIKVFDGGGTGGIFMGHPYVDMLEKTNGLEIDMRDDLLKQGFSGKISIPLVLTNHFNCTTAGTLKYTIYDARAKKGVVSKEQPIQLNPLGQQTISVLADNRSGMVLMYTFVERNTPLSISKDLSIPYLLTPVASDKPRINVPRVFGVRPASPFLFHIAATGRAPLQYHAEGLPEGLALDHKTGNITGKLQKAGVFTLQLKVSNKLGEAAQTLLIQSGDALALTPIMGWNSWNCWGISVTEEKVKSSAKAMIDKGLINHGWEYINIDDGWQSPRRANDSSIVANEKFPHIDKMGDWLHAKGLKFGIYSSPGPLTCGGYTGSWRNEVNDAASYASWGIDYLKYDWCSYDEIAGKDTSLEMFQKPYRVMQRALNGQKRDIVYSLCQYGMKDVWTWGNQVGGQSWRTTGDIEDNWESLLQIGFHQNRLAPYAGPGHWNDPDMMIVGQVGWGENLHPSRLTPDEQYTHVSLWCMLSAPLLIGCDISRLDPFTLNLLTNDEVIAIDQDPLGKQATLVMDKDSIQVWKKELAGGGSAVAVFNMGMKYTQHILHFKDIGLRGTYRIRDLWRQQNVAVKGTVVTIILPPHGVYLYKIM